MEDEKLHITRRRLPHWTIKGSTYFVTFNSIVGELAKKEQTIVLEHIKSGHGKYYTLYAVAVMQDHVHLLIEPVGEFSLTRIMKGIKGVSARKINQLRNNIGSIWQDESYDRIVRDQKEFEEKLNYMYNNPIKSGLTDDPENYHGWFSNYHIL